MKGAVKLAKTDQIQVRVSSNDKERAKELFARYGLNVSAAVNLFIKRSLQEGRLPFNFDDLPSESPERFRKAENS